MGAACGVQQLGRLLVTGIALSFDNLAVGVRARHLPRQPPGCRRRHRHGQCRDVTGRPGTGRENRDARRAARRAGRLPGPHRRGCRHRHRCHLALAPRRPGRLPQRPTLQGRRVGDSRMREAPGSAAEPFRSAARGCRGAICGRAAAAQPSAALYMFQIWLRCKGE